MEAQALFQLAEPLTLGQRLFITIQLQVCLSKHHTTLHLDQQPQTDGSAKHSEMNQCPQCCYIQQKVVNSKKRM